jgi:hypothetical protein
MHWQTQTALIFLSPLAGLWTAFAIYETARAVALIRKGGRHGR